MHILMVAAENGALPGGKVGGLGDVIRDVPRALARAGHTVTVLTPGYQSFSRLPGAQQTASLTVRFGDRVENVSLFRIKADEPVKGVEHWAVEHPLFAACGEGMIYCAEDANPFALDAGKFALFCVAACQTLITGNVPMPDVIHLHDWHTALLPMLVKSIPAFKRLGSIRSVYSIHNLSIQGVRPLRNHHSSLEAWFPGLVFDPVAVRDPVHPDCINLMRTGINLADKVHAVSPTYAGEILRRSEPERGFVGGENLEKDLLKAREAGRLVGILNGCDYPPGKPEPLDVKDFIGRAEAVLFRWIGGQSQVGSAHYLALERLRAWSRGRNEEIVLASVGRLTGQKVSLLTREISPGTTALDAILQSPRMGMYLMLGSGESGYESFMLDRMAHHDNFIFLHGFDSDLADAVYRVCDLFLMPSSYEPCGISQMLAMRAGKPCLVHEVGGLADTVRRAVNGFTFSGDSPDEQVRLMLATFEEALRFRSHHPEQWKRMGGAAAKARFSWDDSIKAYEEKLYAPLLQDGKK